MLRAIGTRRHRRWGRSVRERCSPASWKSVEKGGLEVFAITAEQPSKAAAAAARRAPLMSPDDLLSAEGAADRRSRGSGVPVDVGVDEQHEQLGLARGVLRRVFQSGRIRRRAGQRAEIGERRARSAACSTVARMGEGARARPEPSTAVGLLLSALAAWSAMGGLWVPGSIVSQALPAGAGRLCSRRPACGRERRHRSRAGLAAACRVRGAAGWGRGWRRGGWAGGGRRTVML